MCKYCHIHKLIDSGGAGLFDVLRATSAAASHLGSLKRGHSLTKDGLKTRSSLGGQLSLRQAFGAGLQIPQATANAMGNFDIQRFRTAAVL